MNILKHNFKSIIVTSENQKNSKNVKPLSDCLTRDYKSSSKRFSAYKTSEERRVINSLNNSNNVPTKQSKKKPRNLNSLSSSYRESFFAVEAEINKFLGNRSKTRKTPDDLKARVKELEDIIYKKEEIIESLKQKNSELEERILEFQPLRENRRDSVKDQVLRLFSKEKTLDDSETILQLKSELDFERRRIGNLQGLHQESLEKIRYLNNRISELESLVDQLMKNKREIKDSDVKVNILEKLTQENKELFQKLIECSDKLFDVKVEYKEIAEQNSQIISEYKNLKEKNKEIPQLRLHVFNLLNLVKTFKHNVKGLADLHVEKQLKEKEAHDVRIVVTELEHLADESRVALKSFIDVLLDSHKLKRETSIDN